MKFIRKRFCPQGHDKEIVGRTVRRQCVQCDREYYSKHKAQHKSRALELTYGITLEEYNDMLAKQNNCCAICSIVPDKGNRRLAVDHDHLTGKIRGLLCDNCNNGLGRFKDRPDLLQKAASYLTV